MKVNPSDFSYEKSPPFTKGRRLSPVKQQKQGRPCFKFIICISLVNDFVLNHFGNQVKRLVQNIGKLVVNHFLPPFQKSGLGLV